MKVYAALCGVRFNEVYKHTDDMSAKKQLPVLAKRADGDDASSTVYEGRTRIVEMLRQNSIWCAGDEKDFVQNENENNENDDDDDNDNDEVRSLSFERRRAKVDALIALIDSVLSPALDFNWWLESENLAIVGLAHTRHLSFPATVVEGRQKYERVKARLDALGFVADDADDVYARAERAYEVLSVELGDKPFMLGASPSLLDAVAVGHLALALHAPMDPEHSQLMTLVGKFDNLVDYTNRVLGSYLRNAPSTVQSPAESAIVRLYNNVRESTARERIVATAASLSVVGAVFVGASLFSSHRNAYDRLIATPLRRLLGLSIGDANS
jgi:glutathione S-transferase